MIKPRIYIDTVIARDWTHNRNDCAKEILNQIREKKLKAFISVFGLMELVDIEQEELFLNRKVFIEKENLDTIFSKRKRRDLKKEDLNKSGKYIEDFLKNYEKLITPVDLTNDGWNLALVLGSESNLNATDVIHLASAWQNQCNIVITRDEFFIKEATQILKKERVWKDFKILNPTKALALLKKI